jgi:hypothetical protein
MSNSHHGGGSALQRGLDRARFMLERFVLRGVHSRLLFAAAIVAIVSLVAGAIVLLADPETTELGDAMDAARFLERQGASQLRIVILADQVDQARIRELREALGDLWNDRQVLLRSGSPLRLDLLERVAFRNAAVLILPGATFAERNPQAADAQTIKTLLAIATHVGESDKAPLAVAALYDARKTPVAHRAYAGESEIVSTGEIISRIIAQSVWQHGLCEAFTELLTLEEGNAIYVRRAESEVGARFGELRGAWPKAVLLGTFRRA